MPSDLFQAIRRIQIQTMRLAKDVLAGSYRSAFKGRGMEFEEVREYQQGDDIRTIDWAVTSRMHHPYVKLFREERELGVLLLVDVSASSLFGSKNRLKREWIAEIGAVLAFSAIRNQDKAGLVLFTDRIELYLPPAKSIRHVLRIVRELLTFKPKGIGTDAAGALEFFGKTQAKSCVCFLISDFFCPDFSQEAKLVSLKHDLVGIRVVDPVEKQGFSEGLIQLRDLETGAFELIDAGKADFQKILQAQAEEYERKIKKSFLNVGGGFISLQTDSPYIPALRKFFHFRGRHFGSQSDNSR